MENQFKKAKNFKEKISQKKKKNDKSNQDLIQSTRKNCGKIRRKKLSPYGIIKV